MHIFSALHNLASVEAGGFLLLSNSAFLAENTLQALWLRGPVDLAVLREGMHRLAAQRGLPSGIEPKTLNDIPDRS